MPGTSPYIYIHTFLVCVISSTMKVVGIHITKQSRATVIEYIVNFIVNKKTQFIDFFKKIILYKYNII